MLEFIEIFPELKGHLSSYKVHLAIGVSQNNNPLHAFFRGEFKKWQEWQNKKNFERPKILSLIYYKPNEWIYAGIYKSNSCISVDNHFEYNTELLDIRKDLIGRLVINFEKTFRASYVQLEKYYDTFFISEIFKEKLSIFPFPGYDKVKIDYNYLKTIIKNEEPSWKTALQYIKGVYLITDKSNGKLYVGSAYGEDAFWTRWCQYIKSGHGGNVDLRKVILEKGSKHAENFIFSILEIRSYKTDDKEIKDREDYWKKILLTREFGYNKN